MLSMEPAVVRQSSSCAKVKDASHDLVCDPWSIQSALLPYQTGALASAGGAIYEGMAYCTMSQFFTLAANVESLKFRFFFCYKSKLWNIRSHAETPCAQVSSWSVCPFKRYRRKAGPREAETDSSRVRLIIIKKQYDVLRDCVLGNVRFHYF